MIMSSSLDRNIISFPQLVQLFVILLVVTLVVALVSYRLRLPYTLILIIAGLIIGALPVLQSVHLDPDMVLFLFLPVLLFEGAWSAQLEPLIADWLPIFLLAVPGLLLSLFIIAVIVHYGIALSWLMALLLGAMISPTDPVAVLSLLQQLGLPTRMRTIVEGESLFNDGIGATVFVIVLGLILPTTNLASASLAPTFWHILGESLWLVLGGPLLGLGIGWSVTRLLLLIDEYIIEITATLTLAYGVYIIATLLHTSGLLAVVMAGLVVGTHGRQKGMSERTLEAAHIIWGFLGYIANSLLFLLLGIQIGASQFIQALPGIIWAVVGVVIGRVLIVYLFLPLNNKLAGRATARNRFFPIPMRIPLDWHPLIIFSGLRGALSIALILSLPATFPQRYFLENIIYGVVLLTLLGQGLGMRILLPRLLKRASPLK